MWNEERTALAIKYWSEGFSASECAKLIGGVSRNAVIGKIHRLGLAERMLPSKPRNVSLRVYKARTHQPKPQKRKVFVIPVDTEVGTQTILTLEAHMCKWPFGDEHITFCGHHASGSYCPRHEALSHGRKYYEVSALH